MAKILPFKKKTNLACVACCEECCNSWVAFIPEDMYKKFDYDHMRKECPYCKKQSVFFMTREKH